MRNTVLFSSIFLLCASWASATPTLVVGTSNYLGTGLSPRFGAIVNFDDLATEVANSASGSIQLPANQYASVGVASITNAGAPLLATTFSQQSAPIYLTTGASDGYAGNITIQLAKPVSQVGIGILSDDTTPVTLNALGSTGNVLASFSVLTSANSNTPENGYWAIQNNMSDIQGLQIVSAANLGIDDLQYAPEPSSIALLGAGVLLVAFATRRKRLV